MRSIIFVVGLAVLLVGCAGYPVDEAIQRIPTKQEPTQSRTGVAASAVGGSKTSAPAAPNATPNAHNAHARSRRAADDVSNLLPSLGDQQQSAFGEQSQLDGGRRIKVLPAYLG